MKKSYPGKDEFHVNGGLEQEAGRYMGVMKYQMEDMSQIISKILS